ncbi:helix-turn-helix transcriptional regulator [Catenulispora pinisilvae]|uniref:helix-turn-helix transcriptional regulator n=1 Tax=Catenulispora pinisilvae TaxID=2705253 RepID=UPI00189168A5|nr:helix-turn-helix transcriptional regulator [Catenulispora pinisilvae]
MDNAALAEFLRARRAVLRPEDVGLDDAAGDARRRVAGLRREELAMLAGVSADYYVRLEQGRGHRPSDSVLDSLARALRLDGELTEHLYALARPTPGGTRARERERVADTVQELLDAWTTTPATVTSRRLTVIGSNALACELADCYAPGTNLLRALFLDPGTHQTHVDWHTAASDAVANFRARIGTERDDPELAALIGELSLNSQDFRELWARHDVRTTTAGAKGFRHPEVGVINLLFHAMPLEHGQVLTVLHARPGSSDEQSLALLATMIATRQQRG